MRNHHKVRHLETEVAQNSHKMSQSALEFFAQTFDWKPGERGKALMPIEIIGGEGGIRTPVTQRVNLISSQAPSTGLGHLSAHPSHNVRARREPFRSV